MRIFIMISLQSILIGNPYAQDLAESAPSVDEDPIDFRTLTNKALFRNAVFMTRFTLTWF